LLISPAIALLVPAAFAATHGSGDTIESALTADLTAEGTEALAEVLPELESMELPIDEVSDSDSTFCGWTGGYDYYYALTNMWIGFDITNLAVTPGAGVIDAQFNLLMWINEAADPFAFTTEWGCSLFGQTCEGSIAPFPVQVNTSIALEIVEDQSTGEPTLDATIGEFELDFELDADDIEWSGCTIAEIDSAMDDYLGFSVFDILLPIMELAMQLAATEIASELETAIEDAFSQTTIEQTLELGESAIALKVFPSDIEITPAGIRLVINGSADTEEPAICIADLDPGGSLATASDAPEIGDIPASIGSDYHGALQLSDDFINQLLYAAWRGGILCYAVQGDELGISLETSLLGLMAGDAYDELFPESVPMILQILPYNPPEAIFDGDHDADVEVEDLRIQFYGDLDHRAAMVLEMGMDIGAGADLEMNTATGEIGLALDVDPSAVVAEVTTNEFVPDANEEIEDNFGGLLETMLGSVIDGALGDLGQIALPSSNGIGLTDLQVAATGDNKDWLGMFIWFGSVPYGDGDTGEASLEDIGDCSNGCADATSGCSGSGCGIGSRSHGTWTLLALASGLVWRRRRNRS